MQLRNYLLAVLLYCTMLSANVSVAEVVKMTTAQPRINFEFGEKNFNVVRDRGNFQDYYYTTSTQRNNFFFGNINRKSYTTIDVQVVLPYSGVNRGGNPVFRIPNRPNLGIELMVYDAPRDLIYSYPDNNWHRVFSWGPNVSRYQGLRAWARVVLLGTPEERIYAGDTDYSLTEEVLIGYVKSYAYLNSDFTNLYAESDEVPMYISPFTVIRNISSCTYRTGDLTVNLPTVNTRSFVGNGSEVFGGTFNLNLDQCGVLQEDGSLTGDTLRSVWVTFTDATDPSNRTDKLTLTDSSTATGVKLKIYPASDSSMNVNAIKFGADSRLKGNENSIQMNYNSSTRAVNQRYIVKYVQDSAQVTPGSVNAIATFTFSYQ